MDVRLDEVVLHALEKEPERRYQQASQVKTDLETIAATPTPAKAAPPVRILRWRDAWPWNWEYIQLWLVVPFVIIALAIPLCLHWWGLKALWLLALTVPPIGFAIMYAVLGHRVRQKKAALPRPTGEVAECLMFRRPFESPGLAVLHEDHLELIPVVGSPITVILADIVAVKEVRWFNGTRLWLKKGFVMDLANGQRLGVAVADVFARRWRSRLSRGALPEVPAEARQPFKANPGWTVLMLGAVAVLAVVLMLGRLLVPTSVFVVGCIRDDATGDEIANAELTLLGDTPSHDAKEKGPNARSNEHGQFSLYVGWYDAHKQVRISATGFETLTAEARSAAAWPTPSGSGLSFAESPNVKARCLT